MVTKLIQNKGISLLCSPELKKIKSGEQRFGNWGWDAQCPSNERVLGFKIKVQPPQGSGDDTATNAIRLKCESGYELISSEERWGNINFCSSIVFRLLSEKDLKKN